LNQNIFYRLRVPLSFLFAVIVAIIIRQLDLKDSYFITGVIVPIVVLIFTWSMIYIGVNNSISTDDLNYFTSKCKLYMRDPSLGKEDIYHNVPLKVIDYKNRTERNKVITPNENGEHSAKDEIKNIDKFANSDNLSNNNSVATSDDNDDIATGDDDYYANFNPRVQYYSESPLRDSYSALISDNNTANVIKPQMENTGCLLGKNNGLCSGIDENQTQFVAPIPGPQWQPQSASTVQNRLNKNEYVPATCD